MPGHDIMQGLSVAQKATKFEGQFLFVKEGVPTDGTTGDIGYGKAALCMNVNGSGDGASSTFLYVNMGTAASPTWKSFYLN